MRLAAFGPAITLSRVHGLTDRNYFMIAVAVYGLSTLYSIFLWRKGFRRDDRINYAVLFLGFVSEMPVTISRTGYTGDLGYEILMQASEALHVWDALIAAGHDFGLTAAGILAMDMARVEAGLFMIEVDYTSTTTPGSAQKSSPYELGLDWAVALDKKGYFVGRRALERERRDGSGR